MNVLLLCFKMYYFCVLIGEESLKIGEKFPESGEKLLKIGEKLPESGEKLLNDEYNPLKEADFLCQKKKVCNSL